MDRRTERDRDRELERQSGRYRERERDFSDRKDRDYSDEREHDKNLERTRSNRSRSPLPTATASTRWDDPLKQFSEKHKPDKPPKHRAPPNRFNIPPGRQWDGIDRSNGFELAYFKKLAQQERKRDLDYKYTVADM